MIYFFFSWSSVMCMSICKLSTVTTTKWCIAQKTIGSTEIIGFFRVISPITRRFQYFKTINLIYIISCSLFCSLKETSPQTVGAEGGVGGVSWKLYKFWSSSHLYLHSWTMQHYRKRPRNYGLIMVLEKYLWSQLCFWFILI